MSYVTVTTVVEGAVDDEQDLPDDALPAYLAQQQRLANDGLPTEVFAVHHDHDPDLDQWGQEQCNCGSTVWYPRPIRSWNV